MTGSILLRKQNAVRCAAVIFILALLMTAFNWGTASAAPALSVSKSAGTVLLGGDATVRITVKNTGDSRGYNLSLTDTFSSLPVGGKPIGFVSASTPDGALTPTSVVTDPVTGNLTVSFDDITDLVAGPGGNGESVTVTIRVSLGDAVPPDPEWAVGDLLHDAATARVYYQPDGSGGWTEGSATGDNELIPIKLVSKSSNQSTSVAQATGCGDGAGDARTYSYTITAQNNYKNECTDVTVTDAVPDGVEYLGVISGPVPNSVTRDTDTGVTTLQWDVGTLDAGDGWTVQYSAGVRYDYYGTFNGGTNRTYNDYSGTTPLGAPVEDKTALTNRAELDANYLGDPYSDADTATVTACYVTVNKAVSSGTVSNEQTVTFTITYYTSEYYTADGFVIEDVLPDGMVYEVGSAAPQQPDSIQYDTPGTGETTLIWNTLPGLGQGQQASVTFDATVQNQWADPPDPDQTYIVAGDTMTNTADIFANWYDQIDPPPHSTPPSQCRAPAGVGLGPRPTITKEVATEDPSSPGDPGPYVDSATATVGDTLFFRVRMNTADGVNPISSNVQFGNVDIVDWIPKGTQYVAPAVMTYSDSGDFAYDPPTVKYTARFDDQPQGVFSGALFGAAWSLGRVSKAGWWQVEFKVTVKNQPEVSDGAVVYDYGKLSGENSLTSQYSDRDIAEITYTEPVLTVDKAVVTPLPSPMGPGVTVPYTITLVNTGTAPARNVLVRDTLPTGMRDFDPSSSTVVTLGADTLSEGTDYELDYDDGVFTIDFETASVSTAIPPGTPPDNTLVISYSSRVDDDTSAPGPDRILTDTASVTWSTQPPDNPDRRDYSPVTDTASITMPDITIAKSIVAGSPVTLGNSATYRIEVTVPALAVAYSPQLLDTINRDGLEYVGGSTVLSDVSGNPPGPANITDDPPDPSIDWATPSPGSTLTWGMVNPIDNRGQAVPYVFRVEFQVRATGLITPVSQGGSATNPSNWTWWRTTGGDPTLNNTATDRGRINWNDGVRSQLAQSPTQPTTTVQQPHLVLTKTNDKEGPPPVQVRGGDPVAYTISINNNGRSTAYDNLVVDTLPEGMRGTDPSGTVEAELNDTDLVPAAEYFSTSWNGTTGELTVDFDGGTTPVNIPAGQTLVVRYTATVDGDVGSASVLTNEAYVEYGSLDGGAGRNVKDGDDPDTWPNNRDDSSIQVYSATVVKTVTGPDPATVGDEVDYALTVTVPQNTILYGPELLDIITSDGIEYVAFSSSLEPVSGSPEQGASFSGSSDPAVDYDTPDPGATFTWGLRDIDNAGPGITEDYVFRLRFKGQVTGLIVPVSEGGSATDQDNWTWWWRTSGDPTADNRAADTGTVKWNDGSQDRSSTSPPADTRVHQPNLVLTKDNDAAGPVPGGTEIGYTVTIVNNGLWTSCNNRLVDTLDLGMRDADPSGTVEAELNGTDLVPAAEYFSTSWDDEDGVLTVDFDGGTTPVNIPAGQTLVVTYTGTVDSDVGAGSSLRNIASVEFNSQDDGSGRLVPANSDPAQRNTDDSTANVSLADFDKSHDAPGGQAAIGRPFDYIISVTVPANTTIYRALVNDTFPDGITVDSTATFRDGTPLAIGTVTYEELDGTTPLEWNIGNYTNSTGTAQVLTLRVTVHVDDQFDDETPVNGLGPDADEFDNTAHLVWYDEETASPGTEHNDFSEAETVTAAEPYLVMSKANGAAGRLDGRDTVTYTLTMINSGTSSSYRNLVVDTLPAGMRGTDPSGTVAAWLHGTPLVPAAEYFSTSWDDEDGVLTVDFDGGTNPVAIPPGHSLVVQYTATVDEGVGSGASLTNVASVGYNSSESGPDGRQTDPTDDPGDHNTDDSTVDVSLATVAKSQNAPGNAATIGSTWTYTVTVSVPAYTTIFNASAEDTVPDGLTVTGTAPGTGTAPYSENPDGTTTITWNIGDVTNDTASPMPLTLGIDVRVDDEYDDESKVEAGDTFSNSVELEWEDAETLGETHRDTASAAPVMVREPDVTIRKDVDDATPEADVVLTYTITVRNQGDWPAYGVTVRDTVPAGLTYVTGSIDGPGADQSAAPELVWDLQAGLAGPLPPDHQEVLEFQATVDGGLANETVIENTARIPTFYGLPQPDPDSREYGPVQFSANVTVRAGVLAAQKVVTDNPDPGWYEEVTYRITVTNNGDAPAYGLDVRDVIPSPYFSYVDGSTVAAWPPAGSSTADPAGAPGPTLDWDLDARLEPGDQLTLDFRMLVEQWAAYGTATNTGYANAFDNAGTPLDQASDTADIEVDQVPGVSVTKVLDDDGYVPVGQELTYIITVANTGNTFIPVVPLADTFNEEYLEFVSASIDPTTTGPGSLAWDDISGGSGLAPQQGDPQRSAVVTVTFRALQPGTSPQTDDRASVSTTDDEGNTVSGEDTNTVLTITDPSLQLTKTLVDPDGFGFVPVGGQVTYTIRIENTGDTTIVTPVTLTDTFNPEYLTYVDASPAPTAVTPGRLDWADATQGVALAPSGYVEITVNFTAAQPGTSPQTDDRVQALAEDEYEAPLAGDDTNDELTITNPRLTVEKKLAEGQEPKVKVGQDARFDIVVTNSGDTEAVAPLPLFDTYDEEYMEFVGADPAPTSTYTVLV